jgi:hypothetical protein
MTDVPLKVDQQGALESQSTTIHDHLDHDLDSEKEISIEDATDPFLITWDDGNDLENPQVCTFLTEAIHLCAHIHNSRVCRTGPE